LSSFFIQQARRLFAARDAAAALEACRRAIDAAPEDAEAWHLKGTVELALGKPVEACASARRAIEIHPGDAHLWLLAGSAEQDCGHQPAAREAYARAVELAPSWGLAWNRLGMACFELGDAA